MFGEKLNRRAYGHMRRELLGRIEYEAVLSIQNELAQTVHPLNRHVK